MHHSSNGKRASRLAPCSRTWHPIRLGTTPGCPAALSASGVACVAGRLYSRRHEGRFSAWRGGYCSRTQALEPSTCWVYRWFVRQPCNVRWPAGARSEGADAAHLGERLLPIEEAAPASTTRCTPKVRCGAAVACAVVLTACGVVYSSMPDMAPAGRTRQHIHHNSSPGGCAVHIDISASKFRSTHGILWVHNNSASWKAANSPTTTSAGDDALLKRVEGVGRLQVTS